MRGEDIRGRVFVGKKGIALATTAEDRDLHKHLVNSGYVDDVFLRKVVSGESSFSDLLERETAITDLLREITIESLYHLGVKGATLRSPRRRHRVRKPPAIRVGGSARRFTPPCRRVGLCS